MAHLSDEQLSKQGLKVTEWLEVHESEGVAVERYELAGQLAFFCPNCGRNVTWDSIASTETSHYPGGEHESA